MPSLSLRGEVFDLPVGGGGYPSALVQGRPTATCPCQPQESTGETSEDHLQERVWCVCGPASCVVLTNPHRFICHCSIFRIIAGQSTELNRRLCVEAEVGETFRRETYPG